MLFGVEGTPDLMTAILGVTGAGGVAGLVGWVLKVGLPNVTDRFGAFITAQLDAAKADREAGAAERATIMAVHAKQIDQRDQAHTEQMDRRDKMLAMELARLAEAVTRNTEANARTTAVVESLSATVAVLAARVGVDQPEPPPVAPNPQRNGS